MSETSIYPETDVRYYATRRQLAAMTGRSVRTIIRWEKAGLPARQILGYQRTYFVPEVQAWLRTRRNLAKDCREVQLCG